MPSVTDSPRKRCSMRWKIPRNCDGIGWCVESGLGYPVEGARTSYLAVTLPSTSSVTFTVNPSFTALPRHTPLASFLSPETFEYSFASICAFA